MVTMTEVAQHAGVSQTTVSFVLNGRGDGARVAPQTREKVLRVAQELGYKRNEIARSMVMGKTSVVAFLSMEPEYEPTARMLRGALDASENANHSLKILRVQDEFQVKEEARICLERRVAAVVMVYLNNEWLNAFVRELAPHHIPIAVLDSAFPTDEGTRFMSDDSQGIALAVYHLAELGHTRIAHLAGSRSQNSSILREIAWRMAMNQRGLPIPMTSVVWGGWDVEDALRGARELLDRPAHLRPTAVVCAGDIIASALYRVARELGLQVPRDLSVVGFGDLAYAPLLDPPLTTIRQPFEAIGAAGVRAVLNSTEWIEEQHLPTQFVERQSTAPPLSA